MVIALGSKLTGKRHEDIFSGGGNVLYLDFGHGCPGVGLCQNLPSKKMCINLSIFLPIYTLNKV